jgi:hypothetical protein
MSQRRRGTWAWGAEGELESGGMREEADGSGFRSPVRKLVDEFRGIA